MYLRKAFKNSTKKKQKKINKEKKRKIQFDFAPFKREPEKRNKKKLRIKHSQLL